MVTLSMTHPQQIHHQKTNSQSFNNLNTSQSQKCKTWQTIKCKATKKKQPNASETWCDFDDCQDYDVFKF